MELAEPVELINQQLVDLFGIDTVNGLPIWRVVWSEDQIEKRLVETTDKGIFLPRPEVREVPKYRQWIKERFVLEQLVVVPVTNQTDLPTSKLSYEPIFVFGTSKYLPPRIDVAKIVIDSIYAAKGKTSLAKYKDPEGTSEEALVAKRARIESMVEYFKQDESDVADALHYGEGVVVPHNYKGQKEN